MSAGAVEFYQRAKANEGAAKALYERAESREKAYARKWKETVDEGYLGEVKGKYDFVHQSYSRAVLTYERYQVLTALNKYTVNSETPEYYWGCGNEKLVWVDNEGFPSIYEMSDIINYRDNTHVITDYRYDSFGRRIHTAERTKTGMRTIYDGLSFEVVKEAETFLGTRGITSSATGEANLTNYTPHGSDHTRGTRYYFIRDRGQELRTGKNGEALPDRTKGVRTYLYLNGERVAVNNLYNTNHGQYYYGSDILGSVKFVSGQGGQEVKRIEYDIFGAFTREIHLMDWRPATPVSRTMQ